MNNWARLAAAGTLMIILAGCSQASSSAPGPTVTVTVTQSQQGQGGGLGQGSTSPAPATTAPSTAPPTSAAPAGDVGVCVTPVESCNGQLKTEPAQILVSGDGSAYITGLTWTGWGLSGATGSGTLKLDNCNPNCAQGTFSDYQVTVVLSGLTGYGGGAAYATMMVVAPGTPFGTRTYKHLAP